jgi:hypothetical protein
MSNTNNNGVIKSNTAKKKTTKKTTAKSTNENYRKVIDTLSIDAAEEIAATVAITEAKEEEGVITSNTVSPQKKKPAPRSNVGTLKSGAIGSASANNVRPPMPKAEKPKEEEKVAVFSTKNVTWAGVGKVYRGYNIVSKQESDRWLTRGHIRLATPEEIAEEFGNK